jgi:hypothetical protein
VATKTVEDYNHQLVTGGSPMTEGRHYWEVELTAGNFGIMVGAVRPGLDHDKNHCFTNDAYFINGNDGALYGNGKDRADPQGRFATGDRIGVLLDLDAGWMRLYRNGKRCGPGFTEDAGAAGEPPDYGTHSLAQLKDACREKGLPVGGTKAVLRARLEAAAPPPPQ